MDALCEEYGRFDMRWGQPRALWMGAAANNACIANMCACNPARKRCGRLRRAKPQLATFAMGHTPVTNNLGNFTQG